MTRTAATAATAEVWKIAQRLPQSVILPCRPWNPADHVKGAPQCITPGCVRDAQWDSEGALWHTDGRITGGSYFSTCERCGLAHPGYRGHSHVRHLTPAQRAANPNAAPSWPTSAPMGLVVENDITTGYRCTAPLPHPAPEGTECGHVEPVDHTESQLRADRPVSGVFNGCKIIVSPTPDTADSWDVHTADGAPVGRAVLTESRERTTGFLRGRWERWESRGADGRTYEVHSLTGCLRNLVTPTPVDPADRV